MACGPVSGRDSSWISPELGSTSRRIIRARVVLPLPDSPTIE